MSEPKADTSMDDEPELMERLFHLPPGGAFFYHRPQADPSLVWVLRDDSQHLTDLSDSVLTFRAGAFRSGKPGQAKAPILPIALLLCLGPEEEENIYEYWVDPQHEPLLETLAKASSIAVRLYDEDFTLVRERSEQNVLADFANETLGHLQDFEPWEAHEFRLARRRLEDRYADSWSLWKGLEEIETKS